MAELTKQQSIKLLNVNKFRISVMSTARSARRSILKEHSQSVNPEKNQSLTKTDKKEAKSLSKQSRYPQTQHFKKALFKIGALQKQDLRFTFEPQQKDHNEFRTNRLNSLKAKYLKQRYEEQKQLAYNDEQIDQAALGCWRYGEHNGQRSIWRKYKDNVNMLNYDVFKVTRKRKSIF